MRGGEVIQDVAILLLQGRHDRHHALNKAHEAALHGEPAPSLLPENDQQSQAAA